MQPYINIVENFDANLDYVITYNYLGSERITTNEVQIREAVSGSLSVYTRESTKFDKNHVVPALSLLNGKTYWVKIRVQVNETTWSDWSPEVEFMCLRTPNITFDSLDEKGYIYNNDIMMTAVYRQEQGERVETYQFTLMNQNKVPVTTYPVRIPDVLSPSVFTERISDLIKGRIYYIGCRVKTKNGINHFEVHEFIPHFVTPSLDGVVTVRNNSEEGQVLVQSYLKQMLGTQTKPFIPNGETDNSNNYTFMGGEWVIIPAEKPLMYTRLGMAKSSDWIMKIWCKNVLKGLMLDFSEQMGSGVHLKFYKHDNYVTCEKEYNGVKSRTKSNELYGLDLREFYMYVKVVEFRVQIMIVPIGWNEIDIDSYTDWALNNEIVLNEEYIITG